MNFKKIEDFNEPSIDDTSKYVVICHDEEMTFFGYHIVEQSKGRFLLGSDVMNLYGEGFFVSHFMKIHTPLFDFNNIYSIKPVSEAGVGDILKIVKTSINNSHLWTVGKEYKVLNICKGFKHQCFSGGSYETKKGFLKVIADNGKPHYIDPFGKHTKRDWRVVILNS